MVAAPSGWTQKSGLPLCAANRTRAGWSSGGDWSGISAARVIPPKWNAGLSIANTPKSTRPGVTSRPFASTTSSPSCGARSPIASIRSSRQRTPPGTTPAGVTTRPPVMVNGRVCFIAKTPVPHPREGGDPEPRARRLPRWAPAFAGERGCGIAGGLSCPALHAARPAGQHVEAGHADGDAHLDLVGDDRAAGHVGHRAVDLDPAVHRPRVHDDRFGRGARQPLG